MKKKIETTQRWTTDIKDWTKISKDTAALMLAQSECLLKETTETAKLISARADRLLPILVTAETGLLIFILQNMVTHACFNMLYLSALLAFICVLISIIFCYLNFKHYEIRVPGEFPNRLVLSQFVDKPFTEDLQYINMVLSVCENIQDRISKNEIANDYRINNSRKSLRALLWLPICPLVAYLLLQLFPAVLHFGLA